MHNRPMMTVTDAFSTETVKLVADMFVDRWLGKKGGARGSGAKIGIRNPLHCLAWKADQQKPWDGSLEGTGVDG